jgi:hypothetical protein
LRGTQFTQQVLTADGYFHRGCSLCDRSLLLNARARHVGLPPCRFDSLYTTANPHENPGVFVSVDSRDRTLALQRCCEHGPGKKSLLLKRSLNHSFVVSSSNRWRRKSGKSGANRVHGVDEGGTRFRKPGSDKMKRRKSGELGRVGSHLPHGLHRRRPKGCGKQRALRVKRGLMQN